MIILSPWRALVAIVRMLHVLKLKRRKKFLNRANTQIPKLSKKGDFLNIAKTSLHFANILFNVALYNINQFFYYLNRGRPRKSSTDVTSANKPKKPKTSSKDTNLLRSILSNAQAPQCSLNKHTSEATPINTGDELAINSKTDLKSTKGINFMKSKSVSEDCRLDFRQQQISRTYSSGSTPAVASSPSLSGDSTVPSFTLTFPAATPSTQDARSLSSAKQNHEKYTKTASSQSATLQPKLKNNSKNDCIYDQECKSTESNCNYTNSNNGFQFTISNILDKGQNPACEDTDESFKLARKPQDIMQNNCRTDTEKSKTKNDSAINSGSIGNGGDVTDKAFPTISWTMNVVGPQYNASAEIDEDYDA